MTGKRMSNHIAISLLSAVLSNTSDFLSAKDAILLNRSESFF